MIPTGLPYFDKLLGGGFPENTVILLSGGPGCGKTLFGLNFLLEGAAKGEKCCYVTLMENKPELLRACKGIESLKNMENYVDKNLVIQEIKMSEQSSLVMGKFDTEQFVKFFDHYPKIERVVIDNVNKLLVYAKSEKEYRMRFAELIRELKSRFVCTVMVCETADSGIDSGNSESFECDGVIKISFLEMEEKPKRILEVYKLRYTEFEPRVPHEYVISKQGLKLTETSII